MSAPEFDWNPQGDEADNIIVRHQPAIAVYLNPHGDVVIRQEGYYGPEEDQFVHVSTENVAKVAERLLAVASIDLALADGMAEIEAPKDATAAERMRRYRNRKRNGDRNADRNTVTEVPRLIAAE